MSDDGAPPRKPSPLELIVRGIAVAARGAIDASQKSEAGTCIQCGARPPAEPGAALCTGCLGEVGAFVGEKGGELLGRAVEGFAKRTIAEILTKPRKP